MLLLLFILECAMLDWFCGLMFAILPLAFIFRSMLIKKMAKRNKKRLSKTNKKSSPPLTEDEQLELMRCTVDLITYRLSLIEYNIYKDVNPRPYLTPEEFLAAGQPLMDIIHRLQGNAN